MSSLRDMEVNEGIKSLASGILSQAISNIMGVTVRNIATIGGSVMGKFAFSDLLGVLQVLDAELMFYHSGIMNIEDFVNMTKIPKDILLAIRIKKQSGKGYFKKIAITHLDFSILNIAITYNEGIKIAVGSRPNIAIRARRTEEFLNSFKIITEDKINEAVDIAFEEIKLGDNSRASKDYREILMKTYLKRAIREVM